MCSHIHNAARAVFIAHTPTDLRALLAAIRELQNILDHTEADRQTLIRQVERLEAAVRRGRRIEAELDAGYRLVAKPVPDLHDEGCDD